MEAKKSTDKDFLPVDAALPDLAVQATRDILNTRNKTDKNFLIIAPLVSFYWSLVYG
jgi:hypothetical protein